MHSAAAPSLTDAVAALAAVISCEAEGRMVPGDALALDDDLRRHAVRAGARRIGIVGGALAELTEAYLRHRHDAAFRAELDGLLDRYVGRSTPLYRAKGLEASYGVDRRYLKREDLHHTGAHKINNALGQVLLASKMGKKRIIAETGAGQHGVATATAGA